jgi:spore coat polysaccharide biosynthesis protein SpsF
MDVEVFSREALERAGAEAHEPYQREHVTPYLYEQPGRFRTVTIDSGGDFGQLRWTVDTAEDLEFVRQIYQRLSGLGTFGMVDILELLKREPELIEINTDVQQKTSREAG